MHVALQLDPRISDKKRLTIADVVRGVQKLRTGEEPGRVEIVYCGN